MTYKTTLFRSIALYISVFFFLALFTVLFCQKATAQINPKRWAVGGQLQLTSSNNDFDALGTTSPSAQVNNTSYSIQPTALYTFNDRWAVGASIILESTNNSATSGTTLSTSKSNNNGLGIFLRYFKNLEGSGNRFYLYLELGGRFTTGSLENSSTTTTTTTTGGSLSTQAFYLSPGFMFFPSNRWALNFSINGIGFTQTKFNSDNTAVLRSYTQQSTSAIINTFAPTVGIYFFIK